jgi:hypothetical protein
MLCTPRRQQRKPIPSATILWRKELVLKRNKNLMMLPLQAEVTLFVSEYHTECQLRRCHTPLIYQSDIHSHFP